MKSYSIAKLYKALDQTPTPLGYSHSDVEMGRPDLVVFDQFYGTPQVGLIPFISTMPTLAAFSEGSLDAAKSKLRCVVELPKKATKDTSSTIVLVGYNVTHFLTFT